jgi:hypothetical protein
MRSAVTTAAVWSLAVSAVLVGNAGAQTSIDKPGVIADHREVKVNIDNFVRAPTDLEFDNYVSLAGGVNRFFHFLSRARSRFEVF